MSTFSIKKTNVRLTGNIKIVLDTSKNMFIESINSTEWLSMSTYKGFEWSDTLSYGSNVKNFCSMFTNTDQLFDVKNEVDINVSNSLSNQYHQLYNYGCYSEESQLINENFRFFAPIWVNANSEAWPDKFVILKMSGEKSSNETSKDWFLNGELVETFDLAKIRKTIFSEIRDSFIDMSYEEIISANGLSVRTGLYNRIEEHVFSELLQSETTITEFDNWITNIFRRHDMIFSNLVNLEFAFTDTAIDNKFVRYAGFYVKSNELSMDTIRQYDTSGALLLHETLDAVKKFDKFSVDESYDVQAFSLNANSFGSVKKQILEFTVKLNPSKGSRLNIFVDNTIEHSITFNGLMLKNTIEETLQSIVADINFSYQGKNSSISAKVIDNTIRLSSNTSTKQNIRIDVPKSFYVKNPIFSIVDTSDKFIGSDSKTVSLNQYINPEKYTKLMYLDSNGQKIVSAITRVHNYLGDWFYDLSEHIQRENKPDNVWFIETKYSKNILCSILEHKELDMFTERSEYSDILDFDVSLYKAYLLNTINEKDFHGSVLQYYNVASIAAIPNIIVNGQSIDGLTKYKQILVSRINSFFDSIDVNSNFLLNNIDLSTFEASNVNNEYDRLSENTNVELRSVNRLYQYVTKWTKDDGSNVYGKNYKLTIGQPFRYDNFSPSTKDINRDLRYHTHSWFILGEGMPPYYDVTEKNSKKLLSYSKYPITKDLVADIDRKSVV